MSENKTDKKLNKWNWGAFWLAPLWTLANKLEFWTFLCFIPFLNFFIYFYLGYYGNRLAYEKSDFDSVDDFMEVQKEWNQWGIRFIILGILILLLGI